MKHKLYSELRTIYETTCENPHTFRVTIKMKDMLDGDILKRAVDKTMMRYPYFLVKLTFTDYDVYFEDNEEPMVVQNTDGPVTLGSDEVNHHLLSFSYWKNKIHIEVYHALTDGGGIYQLIKTLLYYYCSEYYEIELSQEGIRLANDEISLLEWDDPAQIKPSKMPERIVEKWKSPGFQLDKDGGVQLTKKCIVFNIRIPEKEFMRFNLSNDGSPGTIISLFLSRAIEKVNKVKNKPVVIAMCVNQRKALKAPLAHQSLVGDVRLIHDEKVRDMPFSKQATCFRGMVALQSDNEMVLCELEDYRKIIDNLYSYPSHMTRHKYCLDMMDELTSYFTATVSYVGKTDMGESERYIQEFHVLPSTALPSSATPLTLELSAMNGSFYVNFMQFFETQDYLKAFIKELRENNINYDVLYEEPTKYPNMINLWKDKK